QEAEGCRVSDTTSNAAGYTGCVSALVVDQLLGRLRHQLRALALAAFEKQQALAEDEAIEQERLRIGVLGSKPRRAIELADIFQTRGVDACDRGGGGLVRAGPLPDREFDRHAL